MALVTARSGPLNAGRFVRTVQLFEISKRFAASTTTLLEALGHRSTTSEPNRSAARGGRVAAPQPVSITRTQNNKQRVVAMNGMQCKSVSTMACCGDRSFQRHRAFGCIGHDGQRGNGVVA